MTSSMSNPLDDPPPKNVAPMHGESKFLDPAIKHFRPLGHYRSEFFFITSEGKQVLAFSHTKLAAKATLFMLAPLQWWEREFPSDKGFSGKAVDQAVNFLIRHCYRAGVFRLDRLRGRGAWWDDGRLVIHAGDRLYVDGEEIQIDLIESRYVYEALPGLPVNMDDPLDISEAHKFFELCAKLKWEKPIYGTLLAGWATIAIACGAIPWRPHVFITGPAGCGKSWVTKVVQRLLGDFLIAATGESTEAGLRQALQHDALPVTHDEAEGEDRRTVANMDKILGLMRGASAETDGNIYKGGQSGEAQTFTIRSCFLLSAIRVPLKQTADETRITVLSLERNTSVDREVFEEEITPLAADVTSDEYTRRFRARVFSLLPVLRKNVITFSQAAGVHFGSQRMGDQIGPLAAGAYLLHSDNEIDAKQAMAWIQRQDWSDQDEQSDESDEDKCLTAILEAIITVAGDRAKFDLSVGELIEMANGKFRPGVTSTEASDALARHGILVLDGWLIVSNTHRELARLLRDTSWGVGWGRILKRIDGARATSSRPYFGGSQSRGVMVPLRLALH